MSTSKPELQFLTFNPEQDFSALLQLLAEIELADQAGSNTSEAGLRAQFDWPGHDPRQDRWVVEAAGNPGKLIGHSWTFAQSLQRSILGAQFIRSGASRE
jgi:hypothetical protein